jgi:hypothetical protein
MAFGRRKIAREPVAVPWADTSEKSVESSPAEPPQAPVEPAVQAAPEPDGAALPEQPSPSEVLCAAEAALAAAQAELVQAEKVLADAEAARAKREAEVQAIEAKDDLTADDVVFLANARRGKLTAAVQVAQEVRDVAAREVDAAAAAVADARKPILLAALADARAAFEKILAAARAEIEAAFAAFRAEYDRARGAGCETHPVVGAYSRWAFDAVPPDGVRRSTIAAADEVERIHAQWVVEAAAQAERDRAIRNAGEAQAEQLRRIEHGERGVWQGVSGPAVAEYPRRSTEDERLMGAHARQAEVRAEADRKAAARNPVFDG